MTDLISLAEGVGFSNYSEVNMSSLVPMIEIRQMCEVNRCGRYGKSWSCPPACGTIEDAAQKINEFSYGVLVQTTETLSDDFDYETIREAEKIHKTRFINFTRQVRMLYKESLPLSAGTCTVCKSCTYPEKPCRFPDKRLSSMEAYGLFVSDICNKSNLKYNYGPKTITYTSCILIKQQEQ